MKTITITVSLSVALALAISFTASAAFEYSYTSVYDFNALDHVIETSNIERYYEDWGDGYVTFWTATSVNTTAKITHFFDFGSQVSAINLKFNLARGENDNGHSGYALMEASTDGLSWIQLAERSSGIGTTSYDIDLPPELLSSTLYLQTTLYTSGWMDPKFAQLNRYDSVDGPIEGVFRIEAQTIVPEPIVSSIFISLGTLGFAVARRRFQKKARTSCHSGYLS